MRLPVGLAMAGLAIVAATACRSGIRSADAQYREAQRLLAGERYDTALPLADEGLSRAERNGTAEDKWRFRLLKADTLIGQRLAARALAEVTQNGEPPNGAEWAEVRAHALLLRGRALSELNRLAESEKLLEQAAVAAREAGSAVLSAEVELRQGRLLLQQSRFDEARQAFRNVADAGRRVHDPYQEAGATGNIGFSLLSESRNDEAIPWFERAIALFTNAGANESVARTHGNLGNCYFRLGDYDNARLHYQKAQEWFAKTGNQESRQIWMGNAGNVAFETGDFATAARAYRDALAIARRIPSPVWVARWVNNLAETSMELGAWDAAENYSKEARREMKSGKDTAWEPTSLVTAGRIEEGLGHNDRAREYFRAALATRAEDPTAPLDAHAGLARLSVSEGRTREAESEFRNTVAEIERRRESLLKDEYKLPYLSGLIRFYREYVDFLVADNQPERALEVAESSRSRALESRLSEKKEVGAGEIPTAADYRRLAQRMHAVLLEYWLGPRHSYLWVIDGAGIRLHELPKRSEIHSLLENYSAVIAASRNPLEAAGETGRRLYEALLGPIGDAAKSGRFVIVPDDDLYSFDMESLPAAGQPGKFWIEQATISIAPSLSLLARRADRPPSRAAANVLLVGDAPGSGTQYPRLEYAGQEMDSIARSFPAGGNAILRGEAATPMAYSGAQPGRFAYIHFAAHATANRQSPLDSAVILAGADETNRLAARSVMSVPLSAELVTISACRSAGGRTYAGEGLVGFAWAFLRAGAHNVIAGLWDVSDRSTAELMAEVYRRIAAGKDAPDALRAAKLDLIHKGGAWAKPYYWAPFQLYAGAGR